MYPVYVTYQVCAFFHKDPLQLLVCVCVCIVFSEKPRQQWQGEFPPLDAKKVPLGQ